MQPARLEELRQRMAQAPESEALHIQAALYLAEDRPQLALQSVERSLALHSTPSGRNTLAMCLLACAQRQAAQQLLHDLLLEQPEHADLWFNLARAYGSGPQALQASQRACELRPDWRQAELLQAGMLATLDRLNEALGLVRRDLSTAEALLFEARLVFQQGRYSSSALLCLALLSDWPHCQAARTLLVQALCAAGQMPGHPRLLEELALSLDEPAALDLVAPALRLWPQAESLLLVLLRQGQVTDLGLESWLTSWRRDFRQHPHDSALAEALAAHNFTHEFAFPETPEEVDGLRPDHPAYPLYRPLPPGQSAAPLVLERHLHEPARERYWLSQLQSAPSSDPVARQYQQNPYPRWRNLENGGPARPLEAVLEELFPSLNAPPCESPRVLVAGCGTGRHALQTARRFRRAEVWAIDLSENSLAYALRQQERLGIEQVHFLRGDLLHLDQLPVPECFQLIECIGVLHHLADPLLGLQALTIRLAPAGWMRLGFYSRVARGGLDPARALARRWWEQAGPEPDLRELRRLLCQKLSSSELEFVAGFKDFYSLSGLRDLLLHAREMELDLPALDAWLEQAGLEFVGFEGVAPVLQRQFVARFGRAQLANLDCWHQFESDHPQTFRAMYVFWCRGL